MASIDIFNNDAFSLASMVAAIDKVPFKPSFLGDLGIFSDKPVTTKEVYVEERNGTLSLVQTSPRGSAPQQHTTEKRTARSFPTERIAVADHMTADEIAAVREFGSETELMMMQKEVARRYSGPLSLQSQIELTWEHMRLGAVQGIVLDADGSVIRDWYTEFGITQPDVIYFDLTGANKASSDTNGKGVLRALIQKNVIRPMQRAAKGLFTPATQIYALCGDDFYDDLTNHGDVVRAFDHYMTVNVNAAANAFQVFPWGGVNWVNYRGTDDNSTVAVATNDVKFFPVNAPGMFINAWSPGEFFETVNTPGLPLLPKIVPDEKRNAFVDLELYSYPLHICTRPEALLRGARNAS